jgi:hypothetical protein
METIHISEDEAARDFPGLMARVRAGAEVVIENPRSPDVVLRVAEEPRGRLLSESLAMAEARTKERGYLTWKKSFAIASPAIRRRGIDNWV